MPLHRSASTTLPLLGAAVSSLAGASAFQVPTATALQRTAVGSSAALSAAGRFSVPFVSQAAHLWTSKHGRVRVPPGFGRLRGGQLSSYRMAASDLASQAESATNATPVEQRLGQLRSSLSDKNLDALLVLAGLARTIHAQTCMHMRAHKFGFLLTVYMRECAFAYANLCLRARG